MINVRGLAALAIAPLLNDKGSLTQTLGDSLKRCDDKDRSLLKQLCYGTARNQPKLQLISEALLERPIRKSDVHIHALLLVGLYQLLEMRIPAHAAISETVEAAHQLDAQRTTGLLNAVLRRFSREKDQIIESLYDNTIFLYNHPIWFIEKLKHNWPEYWQEILIQNNQQAPMTLRVNQRSVSRETYLQSLEEAGIAAEQCAHSKQAIMLSAAVDVTELPGFSEGDISVQDEAAQLSAALIDPQNGERILDACAAPGGKLCHLLESNPNISVDALEISSTRAERITDNLTRLNLEANILIADASTDTWWDNNPYDKILVDAPCSATGVIRRNPDIKILRKAEEIHALSNLQLKILNNLWHMLKRGGTLVYATCSIFPQENERLIERFIKEHSDANHTPIKAKWGVERPFGRQLFPQPNGHDGFYYAILKKADD
ncbi:16S rRNA (cytosine(967)-C(5))-methyltransferase RsmB [Neptunomonas antarctica]|uniref:16S rRNA (cytosine(967)-C(5))-methyltransferase n=1 Tax=Neptunomonas antarctica TaxID=619304 RepID=A0A1N7ITU2_9GAMM|nr:16S rRNA (cytosine(967)-C(5))-methyltransferase RsmB [Neptunomonas antarctica]SIS40529.1 16S rRNA m(5)C-967 methyltransferase [Neptunomonas antarctica]